MCTETPGWGFLCFRNYFAFKPIYDWRAGSRPCLLAQILAYWLIIKAMNTLAIKATNISHSFAELKALDSVSLSVGAGSVFGLIGPNGAGKTTMVRVLNGIITPTRFDEISILGFDITAGIQNIRQKVGVLTDTNLYERLSALDNLTLFGELYGLSRPEALSRAERLLAQFDLKKRAGDRVEKFSKGMKQKVAIARALIGDPELVYLDEPTAGLDPEASYELLHYIKGVSSDSSKTFFITSHRLEEMESICNAVAVLNRGRIQAVGAPAELARQIFKDHWVKVELGRAARFDADALKQMQQKLPFVLEGKQAGEMLRLRVESRGSIPAVVRYLGSLDIDVYGIAEEMPTLQDAYLALVKESR